MADQNQAKKKPKKAKKERSYKAKVIMWTFVLMVIDEVTIGIPEADLVLFYIVLFRPKWFLNMMHKLYKYVPHRRAWRPVREVCQQQAVTVSPDTLVADAARLMRDNHVRSLLVVEDRQYNPEQAEAASKKKKGFFRGKSSKRNAEVTPAPVIETIQVPVGVMTDRDIILQVGAEGLSGDAVTVAEVMTAEVGAVLESEDVHSAVEKMREGGMRRVPVVDQSGGLVGTLSLDDTITTLAEGLNDMAELLHKEAAKEISQT